MKKNHYLITGTSRGIGEAIARALMAEDNVLYCISRSSNPSLRVEAQTKGYELHEYNADLSQTGEVSSVMREVFRHVDHDTIASFTLINNAGTVHPITPIGQLEEADRLVRAITVNLIASMLITERMVSETERLSVPRRVVNMSTGAALRPVEGWSAYCTAKAAQRMYADCLRKEQEGRGNPVKVLNFRPGVVDTEMQAEIRRASPESFPQLRKFKDYKEQNQLLAPREVARFLADWLKRDDFGEEFEVDIRDHI